MTQDDAVMVGTLGKPHGVTGEMRAYPTGPTLDALEPGDRVLARRDGAERVLTIRVIRDAVSHRLVRFDEIGDRDAAATAVGLTLHVTPDRLTALDDADEYYVRDLIGCMVTEEGGAEVGLVREVHEGAANAALEVAIAGDDPLLIPFTHDAISSVDLPGGRIAVRSGLLAGGDA